MSRDTHEARGGHCASLEVDISGCQAPTSEKDPEFVPMASSHWESYKRLLILLWETKAWRLLALLLAQLSAQLMLLPVLPSLVTDDFASRRASKQMHCDEYEPKDAPTSCQDAHSDVVHWSTWSGFFQNTIFSIIVAPALGAWSDIHGRKPVLIMAQGLSILPIIIVFLNMKGILPLFWIYVVQAFTGSISSIAPSLAYISDLIPPNDRAAAFGLILASFSIAILIGPPVGAAIEPSLVPVVIILMMCINILSTFICLPESLCEDAAAKARQRQEERSCSPRGVFSSAMSSIKILQRNSLFIKLTLILMLGAVVGEGLQDILIQYLQLKMGFRANDVSKMFMILGAGALLVQGILLRALLSFLGEARLLAFGLVASTFQQCILTFAAKKWHAFFAVSLGSLGSVTFPTISSIKANNSLDHEQGSVQGALYGARSIASGVGPLAFAFLFSAFTKSDSPFPFFPGAPFVLGTVIMIGTTVLACTLEPGAGGNTGVLFSQNRHQQDVSHTTNSQDEEASTSLLSKDAVEK
eukprot:jgi/Picsp_1/5695/NSC_03054-R1_major facilitator superfamily